MPAPARRHVLDGLGHDLRLAARRLLATPMFTIFAVVSIAVGVGVTTAVYSSVDAALWKDVVIPNPARVVVVHAVESGPNTAQRVMSSPDFDDLRAAHVPLDGLSAALTAYPAVVAPSMTVLAATDGVDGAYFSTLGVTTSRGRLIQPEDVTAGAAVVVLGDALWRTRFDADPTVIGRTVRIGGHSFEVVGIAPEGFQGVVPGPRGAQLWVPISMAESFTAPASRARVANDRDRRRLTVFGRLRSGASLEAASAELGRVSDRLDVAYPRPKPTGTGVPARRGWRARALSDMDRERDMLLRAGFLIVGLIALVLVVACTNLSNLVLARGSMRHQELAVRAALGASRWRLLREQLAETFLIAVLGAAASFLVLRFLMSLLNLEVPTGPSTVVSIRPRVDLSALIVTLTGSLLALVVFGLEPALRLTRRRDVRDDLAAESGAVGVPNTRRQRRLLRWQVAISAAFFIIATMCVRYLVAGARHDPGVNLDRMAISVVSFYSQQWDEARARAAVDRILRTAERTPGIQVAVSTGLPFGMTITPSAELSTPDKPFLPKGDYEWAPLMAVTSHYFRVTGTALLRGRGFDDRDAAAAAPVIVISQSAARALFGTTDAVGRQMLIKVDSRGLRTDDPPRLVTIVGISADADTTHYGSRNGHTAYLPFAQEYMPMVNVLARGSGDTSAVRALQNVIRQSDADIGIERIGSAHAVLAGPFVYLRAAGIVAVSLGALTLLLSMVGLYGVQSHVVTHRTREIGVRMSLGATAAQVRAMVLRDGYKPVLQGLGIGLFIGIAGRAIVRSYIAVEVAVFDPWMLLLVPIPLLFAAFLACFLPARRASRVDPNVALRHL